MLLLVLVLAKNQVVEGDAKLDGDPEAFPVTAHFLAKLKHVDQQFEMGARWTATVHKQAKGLGAVQPELMAAGITVPKAETKGAEQAAGFGWQMRGFAVRFHLGKRC